MGIISSLCNFIHLRLRAKPIADAIAPLLKKNSSLLDIGCFDGLLSGHLSKKLNLSVEGVDIVLPKKVMIKAKLYDGNTLPFKNNSFDYAMLIDVLHHSDNQLQLLKEAKRISKKGVVVLDSYAENFLQHLLYTLLDLFTVFLGMKLTYKYLSKKEWLDLVKSAGLKISYLSYSFKIIPIDVVDHIIMLLRK